jgi:hypothetical protein
VAVFVCGAAGCGADDAHESSVTAAVTGDQAAHFTLPTEAQCQPDSSGIEIGTSVAIVPAASVDATRSTPYLLATSCGGDQPTGNQIHYVDPTAPDWVRTIDTPTSGATLDWGSLAYRADRGDLLGCTDNTDDSHDIYSIDIATGATTFLFAGPAGSWRCQGVAWDAAAAQINVHVFTSDVTYVYSETGTVLRTYPNPLDCPVSGLAVSGDILYESCDGAIMTYEVQKSLGSVITRFNSGDQRAEDVECDDETFESQCKNVLWTKEAYNNEVFAFEIPYGSCNAGGLPQAPKFHPGTDQVIVGSCSSANLAYTQPTLAVGSCVPGLEIACTPIPSNSFGVHTVTCTATVPYGSYAAEPVSFNVTVLQPLDMRIQAPLSGDSTPAAPDGSVDNLVKAGSTVPVNVRLYACGADVTTTAPVTVKLGVTYKASSSDAPNSDVTLDYSGVGDTSGLMSLVGAQYHYNLSTKRYQVTGAAGNAAYYAVAMSTVYNQYPGIIVGSDSVRLETH